MIVALTGVTGNMGFATLQSVLGLEFVEKIRVLVYPTDKRLKKIKKLKSEKIEILLGNIADPEICEKLICGCEFVVNMAAVIPPISDKHPQRAVECNEVGVNCLVSAIEKQEVQPKLIQISTVALYGNRTSNHPWAQVGDPLLVSPYDIYSATKLRGEFRVLESDIKKFVVLRQTACLYDSLIFDNLSDGLLFHTCFNSPLEWVTMNDSGRLIANIIRREHEAHDLDGVFWNRVFNIGGGAKNRVTGYDTFNAGLKTLGASAKQIFEPNFNSTRNFHGVWFYDGDELENLFHYQTETVEDFWKNLKSKKKYLSLAKIVPKSLIKKFAIKRLFNDANSPKFWAKNKDEAKLTAYFGNSNAYENLPKNWKNFPLLVENYNEFGQKIDYSALLDRSKANMVNLYFDKRAEIKLSDLKNVARAHGGKLLSKTFNGLYAPHEWENSDGEKFSARPYTVLFAGHWLCPTHRKNVWDFDRLSKKDKIFSQIWHDSHDLSENHVYFMDENFATKIK